MVSQWLAQSLGLSSSRYLRQRLHWWTGLIRGFVPDADCPWIKDPAKSPGFLFLIALTPSSNSPSLARNGTEHIPEPSQRSFEPDYEEPLQWPLPQVFPKKSAEASA